MTLTPAQKAELRSRARMAKPAPVEAEKPKFRDVGEGEAVSFGKGDAIKAKAVTAEKAPAKK